MSTVFKARYKIDVSISEEDRASGAKEVQGNPIGVTKEICGTREEIKERICHEIDGLAFRLEDIYYGE